MTQYRATVRIEIADDEGRVQYDAEQYLLSVTPHEPGTLLSEAEAVVSDAAKMALAELFPGVRSVALPDVDGADGTANPRRSKLAGAR